MEDHVQHLRNYLEPSVSNHKESGRVKAQEVASIAMTVYTFMDFMFEEIEHAVISGPEFLSKSELFLKAVTPSYPIQSFKDILNVLMQVDPNFSRTKFYQGLQGLRALCSGDYAAVIELVNDNGKSKLTYQNFVDRNLVFFGTFLIEQIIRSIKDLRRNPDTAKMTTKDFRKQIDDQFDSCVINTVTKL
jgi:hypothetical protein